MRSMSKSEKHRFLQKELVLKNSTSESYTYTHTHKDYRVWRRGNTIFPYLPCFLSYFYNLFIEQPSCHRLMVE